MGLDNQEENVPIHANTYKLEYRAYGPLGHFTQQHIRGNCFRNAHRILGVGPPHYIRRRMVSVRANC